MTRQMTLSGSYFFFTWSYIGYKCKHKGEIAYIQSL